MTELTEWTKWFQKSLVIPDSDNSVESVEKSFPNS